MVNLDGKFIPILYYGEYNASVRPDEQNKISPIGEVRPPIDLPFNIVLDRFGHVYLLPLVQKQTDSGKIIWDLAYSICDIVEAASGNAAKRKMIDDIHTNMRQKYFNRYVMQDDYVNSLWNSAKPTFMRNCENALGSTPFLPNECTTYISLSQKEATELAAKAQVSSKA